MVVTPETRRNLEDAIGRAYTRTPPGQNWPSPAVDAVLQVLALAAPQPARVVTVTDEMVMAARDKIRAATGFDHTRETIRLAIEAAIAVAPQAAPKPFDPAITLGMTDMMVDPATLSAYMEANPLPPDTPSLAALAEAAAVACEATAKDWGSGIACEPDSVSNLAVAAYIRAQAARDAKVRDAARQVATGDGVWSHMRALAAAIAGDAP